MVSSGYLWRGKYTSINWRLQLLQRWCKFIWTFAIFTNISRAIILTFHGQLPPTFSLTIMHQHLGFCNAGRALQNKGCCQCLKQRSHNANNKAAASRLLQRPIFLSTLDNLHLSIGIFAIAFYCFIEQNCWVILVMSFARSARTQLFLFFRYPMRQVFRHQISSNFYLIYRSSLLPTKTILYIILSWILSRITLSLKLLIYLKKVGLLDIFRAYFLL